MRRADEPAFEEFAASVYSRLRGTAYLLCVDEHLAHDLVQEALVRMYVAWPRLRREGAELAYARRTVLNVFLDGKRKRWSTEVPTGDPRDAAGTDDLASDVSTRTALLAALAQLPPRQRACVVLRFLDDLSVAETAAALGCSEGTVKSQTSRALNALRANLADTVLADLRLT